ncbi:MAG: OmpA family protein [Geothrix sp.]|nr:OmpA family protein [Geothrix sp.]
MSLRSTLTLLLAASSLAAGGSSSDDRYAWLQLQAGTVRQENSFCVKNTTAWGLGGGDWLSSRWGWEASYLRATLEDTAHLWKAREGHLHASALHSPFGQLGAWRPFLRGGLGVSDLQAPASLSTTSTRRLNLVGGLGTQYLLSDWGVASLEARYVNVRTAAARSEYQVLAGLGLRWGCAKPPAAPAPAPVPLPPPAPVLQAVAPPPPPPPSPAPVPAPVAAPEPEPVKVVAAPAPRTIVLSEAVLHFANNGAEPAPEATPAIQDVADQLKAYPGPYTLMISGHTSSLGSASHNHTLSKRRADAVAKLLVAAGIPSDRIFTVGRGPEVPIADNKTREGQSRNRRVEIEVKAADPSVQKTRTDTSLVDGAQPLAPKAIAKPKK